ncbi:transcriptional regulator TetR [Komagataeibacter xylinus NBRC 13693]|uniref:Transcriptional regulator TetR n=2 Tax=Komagataeibacter xylinus TaxID=28448 RepID=A0A0D6QD66_KOMXY|nr:transcriptional regulator TetR [Komagataeibacter xylinus NBRC 13693]
MDMTRKPKRTNKPEVVKNDLLNAAGRILVTNGIQAFTLELVAREANVSKGGLLHHFPNKKALLDGLFMREMDLFRHEMLASMQDDPFAFGRSARAYIGFNHDGAKETPVIIRHLLAAMLIDPQLSQEWIQHYWSVIRSIGLFENMTPALLLACMAADGLSLWDILEAGIVDQTMRDSLHDLMVQLTQAPDKAG